MTAKTLPPRPMPAPAARAANRPVRPNARLAWLERAVAREVLPVPPEETDAARQAVEEMNNLAGECLAEWLVAEVGCALRLTPRGRRLAVALVVLEEERSRLRERCGGHFDADARLLDRVAVRTSARNQFCGRVAAIQHGSLIDQIHLELPGNQRLCASLTPDSTLSLGLAVGSEVVALVKASAVLVLGGGEGSAYADHNRLDGTVRRLRQEGGRREIVVDLGSGLTAVANAGPELAAPFAPGQTVTVAFRPSSVLIGVVA
ncbi:TOBE domain-containing protein [Oryzomicrobium sp.]|uniref:TOBE domain-containing protein n=1 Tax=Oryzomicrobium sp. TaxID=1911578 RepID=UPI002FE265E9